jgi:PPK2 family polyphosphate:nucleotide phosphotransferase
MGFRKKFVVKPGAKVRLGDIDPAYKGEHESHQTGAAELARHTASLAQLQYKLYAEDKRALLIVLQGLDAAGKDGVIRHVISGTNPQGVNVACFRQPTHEELAHDFLWRAHHHTPANGEIMIFNRSHYEDVLVVRVHNIVPKSVWSKRYDRIREFEKLLIQAGTHIVKFHLHISPEEQLTRFRERLEDSHRNWKIRNSDYTEREYWPAYIEAFQDAMRETSTTRAPWYVIPSNHKWCVSNGRRVEQKNVHQSGAVRITTSALAQAGVGSEGSSLHGTPMMGGVPLPLGPHRRTVTRHEFRSVMPSR